MGRALTFHIRSASAMSLSLEHRPPVDGDRAVAHDVINDSKVLHGLCSAEGPGFGEPSTPTGG